MRRKNKNNRVKSVKDVAKHLLKLSVNRVCRLGLLGVLVNKNKMGHHYVEDEEEDFITYMSLPKLNTSLTLNPFRKI